MKITPPSDLYKGVLFEKVQSKGTNFTIPRDSNQSKFFQPQKTQKNKTIAEGNLFTELVQLARGQNGAVSEKVLPETTEIQEPQGTNEELTASHLFLWPSQVENAFLYPRSGTSNAYMVAIDELLRTGWAKALDLPFDENIPSHKEIGKIIEQKANEEGIEYPEMADQIHSRAMRILGEELGLQDTEPTWSQITEEKSRQVSVKHWGVPADASLEEISKVYKEEARIKSEQKEAEKIEETKRLGLPSGASDLDRLYAREIQAGLRKDPMKEHAIKLGLQPTASMEEIKAAEKRLDEKIKESDDFHRAREATELGLPFNATEEEIRQAKAVSLGLPPTASQWEIIEKIGENQKVKDIKPIVVDEQKSMWERFIDYWTK